MILKIEFDSESQEDRRLIAMHNRCEEAHYVLYEIEDYINNLPETEENRDLREKFKSLIQKNGLEPGLAF